jgi:glycolate dehydrogenase FAD-binding subunit
MKTLPVEAVIEEISNRVTAYPRLLPVGSRSKSALSHRGDYELLSLEAQSGFLEYQPSEYTFTALAGTRLDMIDRMLADHGQFLPFDPPLVDAGATLGGTVAAGLSGSGRYRYGGARDFLLGVKYIDGSGQLVRAGGKVVKNSAGFDIPKLMIGSLGYFGALVELSFKVFPRPAEFATLIQPYASLNEALEHMIRISTTPLDLICLDLLPQEGTFNLIIRIGGLPDSFPARFQRLQGILGGGEILDGEPEKELWWGVREFNWLPESSRLLKVPLTPARIPDLDLFLSGHAALRRYTVGGNLAWVAWSGDTQTLDQALNNQQLSGLAVLGPPGSTRLGTRSGASFARRIKQALDPLGRWAEV